jgi:SAM-dependent methyltransferase
MRDGLDSLLGALDDSALVDAVFSSRGNRRVRLRWVDLHRGRQIQFEFSDGSTTTVENVDPTTIGDRVEALLDEGFRSVFVRLADRSEQYTLSKRGRLLRALHRGTTAAPDTGHDRQPARSVPEDAPFLVELGLTGRNGRVKAAARDKYLQVVRFVDILDTTLDGLRDGDGGVDVVDLGCGAGVLTMAAHHHLLSRGWTPRTVGVDLKSDLLDRLNASARHLAEQHSGWAGLRFDAGSIADWRPAGGREPDLVIALHACDTATDDALAAAVGWSSQIILAAPCCQHDLQAQLDRHTTPPGFEALVRHGIVRERLGDLLTDTVRADLLAARGYRTDVIEFVAGEHTAKNLMIRATADAAHDSAAAARVDDLVTRWGVRPALLDRFERDAN